tara:strand:+ start:1099 stop:1911 length:813 start_codon:yes stop_codon:yes gene_type:complete
MSDQLFSNGIDKSSPAGTIAITDDVQQSSIHDMAEKQERDNAKSEDSIELKWGNGDDYEYESIDGFDPSRFNSVTDVIKANLGLRKEISERPEEVPVNVPEEYEVDTDKFNLDDKFLKGYTEIAKKVGLTQENYDQFLNLALTQSENDQKAAEESSIKWKQDQLSQLGPNPEERWTKINEWADKQGMPDDIRKSLSSNVKSAADVKLWEWTLNKNFHSQPPGRGMKPASHNQVSKASLAKMLNSVEFKTNVPGVQDAAMEMALQLHKLGG